MKQDEQDALVRMRDCWFAGGSAYDLAPAPWQDIAAAQGGANREPVLLALAGQAFQYAYRPAAPQTFVASSHLPELALPTMPDAARSLFRVALKNFDTHGLTERLLGFVASRGFAAHPLDWMPQGATTDAPDLYAPWIDWVARRDAQAIPTDEALTSETWDLFYPAARRGELLRLRVQDPGAARDLLQAKAGGEPAEIRLRLVQVLETNLQSEDQPYLETLLADRSGKIKVLAAQFLARLGVSIGDEQQKRDDLSELAEFLDAKKSLFLRKRSFAPKVLKTSAQERRRAALFEGCSLRDLAACFEVDETTFVEDWSYNDLSEVDEMLVGLAMRTAGDATIRKMKDCMVAAGKSALLLSTHLIPRLPASDGFDLQWSALKILDVDSLDSFQDYAPAFSMLEADDVLSIMMAKTLRADIADTENGARQWRLERGLRLIGFLARHEAAQTLLDHFIAAGLPPMDPSLTPLRLNAALPSKTPWNSTIHTASET